MPQRVDPPGTRCRTIGQENGTKVDRSQKSSATPIRSQQLDKNPRLHPHNFGELYTMVPKATE